MEKLIIIGTGLTGKRIYEFVKFYGLYDVLGFAAEPEYADLHTRGGAKLLTSILMSYQKHACVKMHWYSLLCSGTC